MLAAIYAGWHGDYLVSSLAFLLGLENFELAERESTPDMVTG